MIVHADGWLDDARRVRSTNFDARPAGTSIELIVIHNISLPPGRYKNGYIEQLFTNRLDVSADSYFTQLAGLRVSTHLLIERDGTLTQFVSLLERAWHAGSSTFAGRTACNDFSIGIELEGTDFEAFADAQYRTLNTVIVALATSFPIKALVGHNNIASNRKTDPGAFFDWRRVATPPGISTPAA